MSDHHALVPGKTNCLALVANVSANQIIAGLFWSSVSPESGSGVHCSTVHGPAGCPRTASGGCPQEAGGDAGHCCTAGAEVQGEGHNSSFLIVHFSSSLSGQRVGSAKVCGEGCLSALCIFRFSWFKKK